MRLDRLRDGDRCDLLAELALDGIEDGSNEVLVDAMTRQMKAALAGPVEGLTVRVER